MSRIRSVKPEFFTHRVMGRSSDSAQVLAIALITYADDEGFFWFDEEAIHGALRPHWSLRKVRKTLQELITVEWISVRKVAVPEGIEAGRASKATEIPAARLPKFLEHQAVSHPKPSKIRPFWPVDSMNVPGTLQEDSSQRGREGRGREGKGEEAPPSPVGRPLTPPANATPGDLFWWWFQDRREADGHVREKPPRDLSAIWSAMMLKLGGDEARARRAAGHYLAETKAKGAPWAWFATQWERYASAKYGQTLPKGAAPESDWSNYREGDTIKGLGGGT